MAARGFQLPLPRDSMRDTAATNQHSLNSDRTRRCGLDPRKKCGSDFARERSQFSVAFRRRFDTLLLPDEPLPRTILDPNGDILTDHEGWRSEELERAGAQSGEECGAVATTDADVGGIHRESDDLEAAGVEGLESCDLCRCEFHGVG